MWEGHRPDGSAVACQVYVRKSARGGCTPAFYRPDGAGQRPVGTAPVAGTDYEQVGERVSRLDFACDGNDDGGGCHWEIAKVICADNANAVQDQRTETQVARQSAACGARPPTGIWSYPSGRRGCAVTVEARAPAGCPATLRHGGSWTTVEHGDTRLITIDVRQGDQVDAITLECGDADHHGTDQCDGNVVSQECR